MGEVDLLLVLVPLEHREIDDPGEFEAVFVDQVQILADLRPRVARKAREFCRIARHEESGVAGPEAELTRNDVEEWSRLVEIGVVGLGN